MPAPAATPAADIRIALTVGGDTATVLRLRLAQHGVQCNPLAHALFEHPAFRIPVEPETVRVVCVSLADVGLRDGGTFAEAIDRAATRGLAPCPAAVGPYLRLAWRDQPEGHAGMLALQQRAPPGSVTVASLPLCADDDVPKGFYLRVIDGVPWLRGYRSWPGHRWSAADVLAFAVSG